MFSAVQQYQSARYSNYNGLTASYQPAADLWLHGPGQLHLEPCHGRSLQRRHRAFVLQRTASILQYQINPTCLRCNNYGNADYDIRSYFSASYVWQTPWKFGNKYVNGAFGGWTISQNFFARTGLPFTVMDGTTAIAQLRARATTLACINQYSTTVAATACGQACRTTTSRELRASTATTSPAPLPRMPSRISGATRIMAPGSSTPTSRVNKNFKLTERMAFGVGANFYNVFNHPNFDHPG